MKTAAEDNVEPEQILRDALPKPTLRFRALPGEALRPPGVICGIIKMK